MSRSAVRAHSEKGRAITVKLTCEVTLFGHGKVTWAVPGFVIKLKVGIRLLDMEETRKVSI